MTDPVECGERIISLTEARTHFYALAREVKAGATVTITRNGIPAARLEPIPDPDASPSHDEAEGVRVVP